MTPPIFVRHELDPTGPRSRHQTCRTLQHFCRRHEAGLCINREDYQTLGGLINPISVHLCVHPTQDFVGKRPLREGSARSLDGDGLWSSGKGEYLNSQHNQLNSFTSYFVLINITISHSYPYVAKRVVAQFVKQAAHAIQVNFPTFGGFPSKRRAFVTQIHVFLETGVITACQTYHQATFARNLSNPVPRNAKRFHDTCFASNGCVPASTSNGLCSLSSKQNVVRVLYYTHSFSTFLQSAECE